MFDRFRNTNGWALPRNFFVFSIMDSDNDDKEKMATQFKPLAAGAKFDFTIRFHNLRRAELGALIWALTWGDDENLCHSLGMAKPFGLGQVKIDILPDKCLLMDSKRERTIDKLNDLKNEFIAHMKGICYDGTKQFTQWEKTEQMIQLLALADPRHEPAGSTQQVKLKHMVLEEYRNAKSRNRRESLHPHAEFTGDADADIFKSEKMGSALLARSRECSRLPEDPQESVRAE